MAESGPKDGPPVLFVHGWRAAPPIWCSELRPGVGPLAHGPWQRVCTTGLTPIRLTAPPRAAIWTATGYACVETGPCFVPGLQHTCVRQARVVVLLAAPASCARCRGLPLYRTRHARLRCPPTPTIHTTHTPPPPPSPPSAHPPRRSFLTAPCTADQATLTARRTARTIACTPSPVT